MEISSSEFIDVNVDVSATASYETLQCKSQLNNLYVTERYGKRFVLKTLKPEFASQSMYNSLLKKEFDLMSQLDHPNIVRFWAMEDVPQLGKAIVMEYVDGDSLKDFIATNPSDQVRYKIVMELLSAMDYMHSKQIIHRDLKPSNILITHNGHNVKVIDFGLADGDDYTIFKTTMGTLKYASPEQLNASSKLNYRTDIYSFGKILQFVFPNKYKQLAERCLNVDPNNRPQSARDIIVILQLSQRKKMGFVIAALVVVFLCVLVVSDIFVKSKYQEAMQEVDKMEVLVSDVAEVVELIELEQVTKKSIDSVVQQMLDDLYAIYNPIIADIKSGKIEYYEIASARVDKTIPEVFDLMRRYEEMASNDTILLNELKNTWNTHRSDILRRIYSDYISNLPLFYNEYDAGRINQAEFDSLCMQWSK